MSVKRILLVAVVTTAWYVYAHRQSAHIILDHAAQHPEWPAVQHHSSELLHAARHVARDTVIELLERDRARDQQTAPAPQPDELPRPQQHVEASHRILP